MSAVWGMVTIVVLIVGLTPGVYLASRHSSVARLVGLQLVAITAVLAQIGISAMADQSSYLIAPLVLAILSVTGTLVYTRLLHPRIDDVEQRADGAGNG